MRETYELKVHIACDQETGRWYVTASDIPGLRLEDENPLALIKRIQEAAPELIELNESEIMEACWTKARLLHRKHTSPNAWPSIKPVFDSPLALAHA